MLKKMVILAVVGFVAVSVLATTKVGSYIRSEINEARKEAEDSVPPEKEIARLRNEVKLLDKDMMGLVNQLAKERVEVAQLQEKVNDAYTKQEKDKAVLKDRAEAIKKAEGQVVWGNRKLSVDAAKEELALGVKRYEANQKTLDTMDQTLSIRIKNRDILEKQLEAMKNQKQELSIEIDKLESDLTVLKLQQMESKYQTDDTRLAKIKEDMGKLKTRVKVEREKLNLMPAVVESNEAPKSNSKSVDDIIAPLNAPPATKTETPKTNAPVPHAD
jgi:hypothetical protein